MISKLIEIPVPLILSLFLQLFPAAVCCQSNSWIHVDLALFMRKKLNILKLKFKEDETWQVESQIIQILITNTTLTKRTTKKHRIWVQARI